MKYLSFLQAVIGFCVRAPYVQQAPAYGYCHKAGVHTEHLQGQLKAGNPSWLRCFFKLLLPWVLSLENRPFITGGAVPAVMLWFLQPWLTGCLVLLRNVG